MKIKKETKKHPHGYSDEQLESINIGELTQLNGQITLTEYDANWPAMYEMLSSRVQLTLAGKILILEHVGSTSVPGLAAKPVIDMLLAVADASLEQDYVQSLEEQGFELIIREPEWHQHRLFKASHPVANLHVFSMGCVEILRMIKFRDWLITNPTDRHLYQSEKIKLAKRIWKHTQNYADAKSDIVTEILNRISSATTI